MARNMTRRQILWAPRLLLGENMTAPSFVQAVKASFSESSHQTGWTGLVARLIQGSAVLSREGLLERGSGPAAFLYGTREERARVK